MKKLTIKPFKSQPKLPDDFEAVTWAKLRNAIQCVYKKTSTKDSKEELYRAVEDMCMHKLGSKLYENVKRECEFFIHESVDSLIGRTADSVYFLSLIDAVWKDHCDHISTLSNIFLCLDRSYVLETPGVHSLWDMSRIIFQKRLESRADLETILISGLLNDVEADRIGQSFQEDVTKRLVRMLVSLGQYHRKFEAPFLQDTERFFFQEGQRMVNMCDPSDFLLRIEKRLAEAVEMTHRYIDPSTKLSLLNKIEIALLKPHVQVIVEKGMPPLLEHCRIPDLRRMFLLLDRVGSADLVKSSWIDFSRRQGESLIKDPAMEKTLVDELLALHDRMENVLRNSFGNHDKFKGGLRQAFEHVVNISAGKTAEMLARHVDKRLRGEKGVSEEETEHLLDRCMTLFRYIQSKDVFEAFYRKTLSKRLLYAKSASADLEKAMISKLKAECGANYTVKLEGMFQDIDISVEVESAFRSSVAALGADGQFSARHISSLDFGVQILTQGYWPINPPDVNDNLKLPMVVRELQDKFTNFYVRKYQGRRLVWAHASERCVVSAWFPKGKKELEVSLYQALCLLLFNQSDTSTAVPKLAIPYKEILTRTNVEDGELRRTLLSLACGLVGTRVLTKEPKGKDVGDDDTFRVNSEFVNKLFRVKINTIQLKENAGDVDKTYDEVFRDRQYFVDSVIVRILKARKRISHTNLMGELLQQIKFPAKPQDLKKRIESLIEREYLERDADDASFYNYLA